MRRMEEMILERGDILPGGILKVGSFLNQQIDTSFLKEIGEEVKRLFEGTEITKILTIESSGISIACACGMAMDVPVVFAKKHKTSNVDGDVYKTAVFSFTHKTEYNAVISSDYLTSDDKVLLVDDFLASGSALAGLMNLCDSAGAEIVGTCVAIEKKFQGGGDLLRKQGMRVEALACIESMEDDGSIKFCSP